MERLIHEDELTRQIREKDELLRQEQERRNQKPIVKEAEEEIVEVQSHEPTPE